MHQATPGGLADKTREEGVAYCIGEYLSNVRSWQEQAEAKANDCLAHEKELDGFPMSSSWMFVEDGAEA